MQNARGNLALNKEDKNSRAADTGRFFQSAFIKMSDIYSVFSMSQMQVYSVRGAPFPAVCLQIELMLVSNRL